MEKKALGKGLAALIGEKQAQVYKTAVPLFKESESAKKGEVAYLEIGKLKAGKFQPRKDFDDQKLKELVASIKEKGLLQPILVRKSESGFEIIAGERRFRAAQALALEKVPVIVKDVKDEDALIISLVENIQREELNPIEEARAFQQLIDKFNLSQDDIAKALGKDKATVSNILRLLKLPADIQQHLAKGEISLGHAKVILATDDVQKQRKLCQMAISNSLSVRELENLVNASLPQRKRKSTTAKAIDPYVADLEKTLQVALGTKVRVIAHKKRGKILIEYYSLQDLDRIVNILKKKS
ncbi:MAG: ParB/RepB/Spo0J family partition protein [Candidatus Omnitrophica bacterium]|nr:ParB/RepB/Spo0J family partition protein [Candidatus Omnitrophota bacterium]MDD5351604.1 ParB/RepB/Spo0J family partition protein [Candidatus Omnitrophota bacterium]MDD5550813.1 ParB/RepB/Spo0J family partition protein [Candidatus Omnitrophota bacterium]